MAISHLPAPGATALEHASTGDTQAAALETRNAVAHSSLIVPLFATTMFLSGFLLFLVEPMAAKMVLPILGGVPMVWNGCVVFFQIVMLAGYGYAFGASRWLHLRHHVVLHAAVLVAPAAVLPFMIQAGSVTPPDGNPLGWLLLLLAGSIGLPFFVLSTSASVFQHWLSRTDHPSARDPYFLYSASNLGCLLALASYPIVVEPLLTLREQTRLWTDRLRRVRPAGRRLRGLRMAANRSACRCAGGHGGSDRTNWRRAGHGAAPHALGGAVVHSVEPHARRHELCVDRHRGGSAAVDRAARALPPHLRAGLRPALGRGRGGGEADPSAARRPARAVHDREGAGAARRRSSRCTWRRSV